MRSAPAPAAFTGRTTIACLAGGVAGAVLIALLAPSFGYHLGAWEVTVAGMAVALATAIGVAAARGSAAQAVSAPALSRPRSWTWVMLILSTGLCVAAAVGIVLSCVRQDYTSLPAFVLGALFFGVSLTVNIQRLRRTQA